MLADETPSSGASKETKVALLEPQAIRMKIHRVEDLREKREDKAQATEAEIATPSIASEADVAIIDRQPDLLYADADEIKKRAQTKYLAAKLKKHEATVRRYVDLAWAEASKREQLAPELLIAIIQKESAFRPKVQSSYGAQGLMQVVRRWHRDKLHPSESLFDPAVNIRVGADVLEEYLALADGNLDHALRKYSGNARGYANLIKKESSTLARVAERAATRALVAQG